jgi:hypothetical protein
MNRAFNTLGRRQKKPSSTICTKRALTLKANRNAHQLNQVAAALEQLFAEDAATLTMMEMVWHFLKKKV